MILGIDASTYFEEMSVGAKYFDKGVKIDPLQVFRNQGVSHFRIRVWNDPYDENGNPYLAGTCDVDNFIKLGKLVSEKYGYKIILDFHYSDFWVDPGKQFCPKAWQNLSFEEVKEELYKFTLETLKRAKSENLPIDFVQIGNETTNGMSYPFAPLGEGKPRSGYENLSILFKQGIKAVKEIYPQAKTIIHLEDSSNLEKYKEYFDQIATKYEVPFDVIGMSYYPYWHGTFDTLFKNIEMCQTRFNKPVMIMELGYAFTLEDYIFDANNSQHLVINKDSQDVIKQLPEPISPEGQGRFIKRFLEECKKHDVIGVNYWEPLWLPGPGINWASDASLKYMHLEGVKSLRNEWCNQCLFDYDGNALPGFKEFKLND